MIVLHGSKVKGLESLRPQYYTGNNGCQAGVGVNLTNIPAIALNYAGEDGSVYFVNLDIDDFIDISPDVKLSPQQIKKIETIFDDLNDKDKYRLATDLSGKKRETFSDQKMAQRHFKKHSLKFSTLGLRLDRLKPTVEYDDDDNMVILSATNEFDLTNVNTERLHYCLNLYDNYYATEVLKEISSGLILDVDNEKKNYLSFRFDESVDLELSSSKLTKEDLASYQLKQNNNIEISSGNSKSLKYA